MADSRVCLGAMGSPTQGSTVGESMVLRLAQDGNGGEIVLFDASEGGRAIAVQDTPYDQNNSVSSFCEDNLADELAKWISRTRSIMVLRKCLTS